MTNLGESSTVGPSGRERVVLDAYLPGTPQLSTRPGRIERLFTTLFRRRGEYRVVHPGRLVVRRGND